MTTKPKDAATSSPEKTPDEIQAEIDETRDQLGDTAEALAGKADVKGQAKHKAEEIASKAKQATPDSVGAGAQQLMGTAQQNPVPTAIAGAFVAGVLVGRILSR